MNISKKRKKQACPFYADSIPIGTLYQSLIMNSMVPFGKRVQLSTFNGSSFGQGSALKRGWDWLCNAHLNVKFLPRINAEPGFVSAANLSNHVNLSNLSECAKIGQLRDAPVPAMEGQFYGGYNVVGTSMDYNSTHMSVHLLSGGTLPCAPFLPPQFSGYLPSVL